MKTTGLSFDNIPPLAIPLRFFLTAPLFGIVAGGLLLFNPDLWLSRWHPALLGFTHLLTLGVMAMVMLGALFQLLPVVSSQAIPGARRIAPWVHLLLSGGTLALVGGFMSRMNQPLLLSAVTLLLLAFVCFLGPLILALIRVGRGGDTVYSMRLAVAALVIALLLGGIKALSYAVPGSWAGLAGFAEFHIGWGLGGWVVLLVMAVSYQVIPMFHVAPDFDKRLSLGLSSALFISLLVASLAPAPVPTESGLRLFAVLTAIALICTYALYALRLIRQRKRRLADATIRFWQLGLSCLIATGLLLALLSLTEPTPLLREKLQILAGLLFGYGFAISVIEGMLQKIVPFLIFMHLQRNCLDKPEFFMQLPNMKTLIPSHSSNRQLHLHCLALAALVGSLLLPIPVALAGALMLLDFGWLLLTLLKAQQRYRQTQQLIDA